MKAKHTQDVEALVVKYDKHIKTYLMEIATHEKIVNDLMEKYENKSSSYTPVKKVKETESSEMSNLKQMVKNLEQQITEKDTKLRADLLEKQGQEGNNPESLQFQLDNLKKEKTKLERFNAEVNVSHLQEVERVN